MYFNDIICQLGLSKKPFISLAVCPHASGKINSDGTLRCSWNGEHIPLASSHFCWSLPSISGLFGIQVLNVVQCLVKPCRCGVDDLVHIGWCGGVYWDFLVVHFVYYTVIVCQLVLSKESHTSLEVCSQASFISSRAAPLRSMSHFRGQELYLPCPKLVSLVAF